MGNVNIGIGLSPNPCHLCCNRLARVLEQWFSKKVLFLLPNGRRLEMSRDSFLCYILEMVLLQMVGTGQDHAKCSTVFKIASYNQNDSEQDVNSAEVVKAFLEP